MGSTMAETFSSSRNSGTFHSFPLRSISFTSPVFSLFYLCKNTCSSRLFHFHFKHISLHVEFCFSRQIHLKTSLYLVIFGISPTCSATDSLLFGSQLCCSYRTRHKPKTSQQPGLCVLLHQTRTW